MRDFSGYTSVDLMPNKTIVLGADERRLWRREPTTC